VKIESKPFFWSFLYFLLMSSIPVVQFLNGYLTWYFALLWEAIVILISLVFFKMRQKSSLLYESRDEGIYIRGSKEGVYDPDFLAYSDLLNFYREGNSLVLDLKDGKKVRLLGLGWHLDEVLQDLAEHCPCFLKS